MKKLREGAFFSFLNNGFWAACSVIIGLVYLANCFSPLRLTNDTVRYFALSESLLGSWPIAFGKPHDFLPAGYVYFLAGLQWLHILTPFVICFLQLLYLGGSLFFVKKIFGPGIKTAPFVCFVLLSWTSLKYTITPLSEIQFLFFSTGTIYYYQLFVTSRKLAYLIPVCLFCGISILTRTVGIALVMALLLSFLISTKKEWLLWLKQRRALTICMGLAVTAGLTFIILQPKFITYLSYFFKPLFRDPATFITRNVKMHLMDWAELFFNIPYSKTAFLLPPALGSWLFVAAGIFFLWFVLKKMYAKRKNVPLSVRTYMLLYMLLIFNWPFFDARFWLPLISFIAAIMLQEGEGSKPRYSGTEIVYACCHVLSGVFVLCYYTTLSFDRQTFVDKHDEGKWKREYEYHFGMTTGADSANMNKKALYLLQKHDR